MLKLNFSLFYLLLLTSTVLAGCASNFNISSPETVQPLTAKQRTARLLAINKWQLRGRIAFIEKISHNKDRRNSFTITWQVDDVQQTQELNLTSFGINVLHLESNQGLHLLKVDGEEYHTANLASLIRALTGLTLPTTALTLWLKGLPYEKNDDIKTDPQTKLPLSISSYHNNALWQIHYSDYQHFDGIAMATKFTIEKGDLLIRVAVKEWSFDE